jgi:hypothetical protein
MKKLFCFMTAVAFLFGLSSSALAGYAIKLKNGRILMTTSFWEDNGVIKFYWETGIAMIPKEIIRSIGFVKEVPATTPPKPKDPVAEPAPIPGKEERTPVAGAQKDKIDNEYYKKQKAEFTEKFEQAHERYLEASSRGDGEAKKKAWEEFNQHARQVSALEEELKKKNNGILPQWWNK